jgi:dihydrofolate reductase
MTALVLKMSVSLDGYVARTDGSNDWIFPSSTPDSLAWVVDTISGAGAHLVGARTYRDMAALWPGSDSPIAAPMNDKPKVVFSASMTESIWGDTRFVSGELAPAIEELKKEEHPGYLLAHGGARFVRSLCLTGLVDEFRLVVAPVVLGRGERIFTSELALRPVETVTFSGGAVAHVLKPV